MHTLLFVGVQKVVRHVISRLLDVFQDFVNKGGYRSWHAVTSFDGKVLLVKSVS